MSEIQRHRMELSYGYGGEADARMQKCETGAWVKHADHIKAVAELVAERDAAVGLLRAIMSDADIHAPSDAGRDWCAEMSLYLRGNYGLMVLLTPEEFAQLKKYEVHP